MREEGEGEDMLYSVVDSALLRCLIPSSDGYLRCLFSSDNLAASSVRPSVRSISPLLSSFLLLLLLLLIGPFTFSKPMAKIGDSRRASEKQGIFYSEPSSILSLHAINWELWESKFKPDSVVCTCSHIRSIKQNYLRNHLRRRNISNIYRHITPRSHSYIRRAGKQHEEENRKGNLIESTFKSLENMKVI